jgi:hypothetical protein
MVSRLRQQTDDYLDGEQPGDALLSELVDNLGRDSQLGDVEPLIPGGSAPLLLVEEGRLVGRELRARRGAGGPRVPEPEPRGRRVEPRRGGRRARDQRRRLLQHRGCEGRHGAPPQRRRAAEGGVHGSAAAAARVLGFARGEGAERVWERRYLLSPRERVQSLTHGAYTRREANQEGMHGVRVCVPFGSESGRHVQ